MKKLIGILFVVLLLSCEKEKSEPTYCWRCEAYTSFLDYTEITQYCNKTTEEVIEIEKKGSDIFTTTKCTRY